MRSVKINNTLKYHPDYKCHREVVQQVYDMLQIAMEHIDKYFELPDMINVLLVPLKGNTNGRWVDTKKTMHIDPRVTNKGRNLGSILSTFVHELAHAEQYRQGRLTYKQGTYVWNKTDTIRRCKSITFNRYYNLPWEIEAREKQDTITPLLTLDIVNNASK
jgi:hypothetical protein